MKVSVVISAYNEEKKIGECLESVKKIADEIIFIDNSSQDSTVTIAKKYTDKIYTRENNPMLNVNKNFGFTKAGCEWILCLDADERVTEELSDEISSLTEDGDTDGFYIPRKNIIFGKWIEHAGWYPDYQLRLFRKDKGKFKEEHVHEMISINGNTVYLKNPLRHLNYENVNQFLNKMINNYTVSEAEHLINDGYVYSSQDIVKMPLAEFVKRYFAEKGYKDGMHGLVLSLLQGFYHFIIFVRLWEANKYKDSDTGKIIKDGGKMIKHEFDYWTNFEKIENTKNPIKKRLYKVKSKILS